MRRNDVINVFKKHISGDKIILDDNIIVEIDTFIKEFSTVKEISYKNLIEADNGEKGYKLFFSKCKNEGILI